MRLKDSIASVCAIRASGRTGHVNGAVLEVSGGMAVAAPR